jgi:hypothetical protein
LQPAILDHKHGQHGAGHFAGRRTPADWRRRIAALEAEIREEEAEFGYLWS